MSYCPGRQRLSAALDLTLAFPLASTMNNTAEPTRYTLPLLASLGIFLLGVAAVSGVVAAFLRSAPATPDMASANTPTADPVQAPGDKFRLYHFGQDEDYLLDTQTGRIWKGTCISTVLVASNTCLGIMSWEPQCIADHPESEGACEHFHEYLRTVREAKAKAK